MEFQEAKRMLSVQKNVCDTFEERSIDIDIVLPDYCPDVMSVMKCRFHPAVTSCTQSGDRYVVDGTVQLRVLYLAQDRVNVHSYELSQPFHISFSCEEALHHRIEVKQDYVNCRAISPRRIDIHGAFRVFLHAIGEGTINVFSDPCKPGVFCQTKQICETVPLCQSEKTVLIDEMLDLGVVADQLLYTDLYIKSCEHKCLTNKMIVKGVLGVKAVYCFDKQTVCAYEDIPFSQIVDIHGLSDEWVCDVKMDVGEYESILQQTENGSSCIRLNAKIGVTVFCSKNELNDVVVDAYCSAYPIVCETMPFCTHAPTRVQTARTMLQASASLPEGLCTVDDAWGDVKSCSLHAQTAECSVLVSMLGKNNEGLVTYAERMIDFEAPLDCACDTVNARLMTVNCSIYEGELRIQADMELSKSCCVNEPISIVSAVVEDEKQAYPKTSSAVRIVYVSQGDNLWDIAKKHRADVRDIMAENDLTDMVVSSPTMLMIPLC